MNLGEFQQAGAGEQPEPKKTEQEPAGPTREEFAQLNSRLADMQEEARHNRELLAQFVRQQQQPAGGREEEDDDEPEEGDVADDFANNGIEALVKRGVLTKKAAKEIIREEARRVAREEVEASKRGMMQDAELASKFPELADETSDLFKRTREIYDREVKEDPAAARNPKTLMRAAKEAKADLVMEGRWQERRGDGRRQERIDAQAGDRSYGGRGGRGDDDRDDTLSPQQRTIVQKFQASGYGKISEDDYKARAKSVAMGGIPKGGR